MGEGFAEFDAPLVEGVDVPDHALGEDAHFVEGNEAAEGGWGEFFGHEDIRGAVAFEHAVRRDGRRGAFGLDLREGFAEGEGLGLREDIRHEQILVAAEWVEGFCERDEVAGDHARALVDELVETVLAVRAGLAPIDRARVGVHAGAVELHGFAVAFHRELLEVGGEALEVLVVGQDSDGLRAKEVIIPNTEQAVQNGEVLMERRGAVMLVHLMEAGEEFAEIVGAEGDHVREADGGIHRVASPHPVPETEHIRGVDAELRDFGGVCGNGDEMLRNGRLVTTKSGERPIARGLGVGHGLEGREGFGGNDEKRLGRVEVMRGLGEIGAVHIRDEAEGQRAVGIVAKRLVGHDGPEVGAADADIDDIFDAFAGVALPFPGANAVREGGHFVEHGVDLGNDIDAVHFDRGGAGCAQGGVEHGAVLGDVDLVSTEHRIDALAETGGVCERNKIGDRFFGDQVF